MPQRNYTCKEINVTEDGFMTDHLQWTTEIAIEIAKTENIILTDDHFRIIKFLREKFIKGETISIRSINQSGIMDVRRFYLLFNGAALKKASKIAGLPKPSNCI
jgi:TusE/DsrC/DsvC family sulfur relay protein